MEQLAVQIPHSKQFLSFSASKIFSWIILPMLVEFHNSLALENTSVTPDIKVYKRKGFCRTFKLQNVWVDLYDEVP
jgi:hypothetical protein